MSDPADVVQVQFAIDDPTVGAAIGDELLAGRLVACVQQVGPVRSRYHWQGTVEETEEWLFLCKAPAALAERVTARIEARHPYDTPEILVTAVEGGLDRYLGWVASEATAEAGGAAGGPGTGT